MVKLLDPSVFVGLGVLFNFATFNCGCGATAELPLFGFKGLVEAKFSRFLATAMSRSEIVPKEVLGSICGCFGDSLRFESPKEELGLFNPEILDCG